MAHGLCLGRLSLHAARASGERERRPVAVLLVYALLALQSPAKRGLMVGLAGGGEVRARGARAAVRHRHRRGARARSWAVFGAAFAGIVALLDRALPPGRRAARVLRLHDRLPVRPRLRVQPLGAASLARLAPGHREGGRSPVFAAALAFVPRRRDLRQVAGLGAAALIAAQLGAEPLVLLLHPVVHAVRAAGDVRRLPRPRARGRLADAASA